MKKVLLVNTNTEKFPYPIPPVGLCLLASTLQSRYTVKIFDGVFNQGVGLVDEVIRFQPDFIGFSMRNVDDVVADKIIFYPELIYRDFIAPVKQVSDAVFILGGSGFSVFPEELMTYTGADFGIVGEGETLFLSLLQALEFGEEIPDHPRIVKPTSVIHHPVDQAFLDVDNLAFSRIDQHIDFTPYRDRGVYSIQTKRGCRLQCIYCNYPSLEGSTYRLRDPEMIAIEIEETMGRLGPVTFEFVDSTFNEPREHAEAICRAIIKRNLNPRLRTMGVNPHNTSQKLFELMREAGFVQIDVTPDSASPMVLKRLKKGFSLADIKRTASLLRQVDLPAMWFFLFGGPGETKHTVKETRDFISEYIAEEDMVLMLSGLRIYPNTPLYRIAIKEKRIVPSQSLIHPSVYYFSENTPKEFLDDLLKNIRDEFFNCILAAESTPPPEMIQEAIALRATLNLKEPMFRTLLRVRKSRKGGG